MPQIKEAEEAIELSPEVPDGSNLSFDVAGRDIDDVTGCTHGDLNLKGLVSFGFPNPLVARKRITASEDV